MRYEEDGKVYDTEKAEHLGVIEAESIDFDEIVRTHLYRTSEGDFFFHYEYPPLHSIDLGKTEEISPVTDRYELVEWAEVHPNPEEAARIICGGAL